MGRCWWAGLSIFQMMGRGPAEPISHVQTFTPGPARLGRSYVPMYRPGPAPPMIFSNLSARPMTLTARPMTNRLCTDRPVISVGRPIDLTGQATGRRVVFNNYHVFVFLFFGLLDSVGQLIPAHEVHLLPTHTIMLNQRPGPMAFVPTGGTHYVLLISDAETPAAAAAATRCCNTCYRSVIRRDQR